MAAATFSVTTSTTGKPMLAFTPGDNEQQNQLFTRIQNSFNASSPGSYKQILQGLSTTYDNTTLNSLLPAAELTKVTDYYVKKNVSTPWDPAKQGANPPTGTFDAAYYRQQNPQVAQQWAAATKGVTFAGRSLPDVDITERYTPDTYLHQHYTSAGKSSGLRGNPAQEAAAASQYQETRRGLTDAEQQRFRDSFFGTTTIDGKKVSPLQQSVETLVEREQQEKFGALTRDVLQQTIDRLNAEKQREGTLSMMKGLPGFDEVFSLKSNLADSLLGDSGIGGYLSMMGDTEAKRNLEKGIQGMLGMGNSMQYNWEKWFDESLKSRYENMTTVVDPADASKTYEMDKQFAQSFINDYLVPRFNTSKSMSEFISYIDVTDEEQNILQTQTVGNKLNELGSQFANSYIGTLGKQSQAGFDTNFYFNPTIEPGSNKAALYTNQKNSVTADWNAAKKKSGALVNGKTWDQWAYQYGLNVNDKEQFARLHYQVKGRQQGFDPSSDRPQLSDLYDYMDNNLIPYLTEAKQGLGTNAFLQFVPAEKLATDLTASLDPLKTPEEWSAVLTKYNIDDTNKSVEEVKNLILEAVRTVPAAEIRTELEALQKKGITPTQEKLGVEYIQRAADDVKKAPTENTALYQIFRNAGYAGTEEDFYTNFMPDTSIEEQRALTSAAKDGTTGLSFDLSDPFAALTSLESFASFGEKANTATDKPSYFTLFGEEEQDLDPFLNKSQLTLPSFGTLDF